MKITPSKLPVWATVKAAYCLTWQNRIEFLKIARWWVILLLPVVAIEDWVLEPVTKFSSMDGFCINFSLYRATHLANEYITTTEIYGILKAIPLWFLELLITASIAVAWHRFILRNESITTHRYLRLDHIVFSYFIFGIFFELLYKIPNFIIFLGDNAILTHSLTSTPINAFLLSIIGTISGIYAIYILTRLEIILPAKALGLHDITINIVRKKTGGSFWRIFTANLICGVPYYIIYLLLKPSCNASAYANTIFDIFANLLFIVTIPIYLTYLSLVYRHFFEWEKVSQ